MPKIESENQFLTSIKGLNSVHIVDVIQSDVALQKQVYLGL